MKLAIWRTGHEIADTVAEALQQGIPSDNATGLPTQIYETRYAKHANESDAGIGYGILRGMDEVFKHSDHWFNVDRGYFSPGHFNGYYRISYRGTQANWQDYTGSSNGRTADFESVNHGSSPCPVTKPLRFIGRLVMICPPTKPVCEFFGIDLMAWIYWATQEAMNNGYRCFVRTKGANTEIDYEDIRSVITFNSSVGWQALAMGIPVLSDVKHSIVGSHYGFDSLDKLTMFLQESCDSRRELFECMRAHQFTLEEIRQGQAWALINHYVSSSDTMTGKLSVPMSAPIPYAPALKHRFQSAI